MTELRPQSSRAKQDGPKPVRGENDQARSTTPDARSLRSRSAEKGEEAYTVGYGRPPEATRFRPGQSGNPRGRVKGSKNARTLLEQELSKTIPVRENGRARKRTKLEVIVTQHVNRAVSGDAKAIESIYRMLHTAPFSPGSPEPAAVVSPEPAAASTPSHFLQTFLAMAREADPKALNQAFAGAGPAGLKPLEADDALRSGGEQP